MISKCKRVGCLGKSTHKGYCDAHQPVDAREIEKKPRVRPEYHRLYNTSSWKRLRRQQLYNQPLCQRCLSYNRTTEATDVDHIVSHKGDPALFYDINNYQSLCHSCHSVKTQHEDKGEVLDYSDSGKII